MGETGFSGYMSGAQVLAFCSSVYRVHYFSTEKGIPLQALMVAMETGRFSLTENLFWAVDLSSGVKFLAFVLFNFCFTCHVFLHTAASSRGLISLLKCYFPVVGLSSLSLGILVQRRYLLLLFNRPFPIGVSFRLCSVPLGRYWWAFTCIVYMICNNFQKKLTSHNAISIFSDRIT